MRAQMVLSPVTGLATAVQAGNKRFNGAARICDALDRFPSFSHAAGCRRRAQWSAM